MSFLTIALISLVALLILMHEEGKTVQLSAIEKIVKYTLVTILSLLAITMFIAAIFYGG